MQADPIRSPARAQDLILRHRVSGYRAGDLERRYPSLDVEEDYLYAYGFVSRAVWRLLHPRGSARLGALEKRVLDVVRRLGHTHPKVLEEHLGARRVVNAWGGYSKATTRALEALHYRGLVRIARRESGIRIYEAIDPRAQGLPPGDRLRALVLLIVNVLGPVLDTTLHTLVARYRFLGKPRAVVSDLIRAGELQESTDDGRTYLYPAAATDPSEAPRTVRFLAPFDPLVWDRKRFEHLWGWAYRFEAYTPVKKRVRGYYAMPMLWGDAVMGWANAAMKDGGLAVDPGYVGKRPRDADFTRELDAEIARLDSFLKG